MPYRLQKLRSGYFVENKKTGRHYSKRALSRPRALAQLRAIEIHTHGKGFQAAVGTSAQPFDNVHTSGGGLFHEIHGVPSHRVGSHLKMEEHGGDLKPAQSRFHILPVNLIHGAGDGLQIEGYGQGRRKRSSYLFSH